jgi:chromosome segregation ATPase
VNWYSYAGHVYSSYWPTAEETQAERRWDEFHKEHQRFMATAHIQKSELQQSIRKLEATLDKAQQSSAPPKELPGLVTELADLKQKQDAKRERLRRLQDGLRDARHAMKGDEEQLAVLSHYSEIVPSLHANLLEVENNVKSSYEAYRQLAKIIGGYAATIRQTFGQIALLKRGKMAKGDIKVSNKIS